MFWICSLAAGYRRDVTEDAVIDRADFARCYPRQRAGQRCGEAAGYMVMGTDTIVLQPRAATATIFEGAFLFRFAFEVVVCGGLLGPRVGTGARWPAAGWRRCYRLGSLTAVGDG